MIIYFADDEVGGVIKKGVDSFYDASHLLWLYVVGLAVLFAVLMVTLLLLRRRLLKKEQRK